METLLGTASLGPKEARMTVDNWLLHLIRKMKNEKANLFRVELDGGDDKQSYTVEVSVRLTMKPSPH